MSSKPLETTKVQDTNVVSGAQAGGGAPAQTTSRTSQIQSFSPTVSNYIRQIYDEVSAQHDLRSGLGVREWLEKEQIRSADGLQSMKDVGELSFEGFVDLLKSEHGNAMSFANSKQDLSYPISNYFISSSHNTYLTGNQLSSDSSVDAYKNVLLRGCRCVEIDVWDGDDPSSSEDEGEDEELNRGLRDRLKLGFLKRKSSKDKRTSPSKSEGKKKASPAGRSGDERITPWRSQSFRAEPRVLHGYTATKEIPFRAVCETIRDYGFVTSDLPVIISLEVHTSHEQQAIMVEIMQETWRGMLVDLQRDNLDADPMNLQLPPLKALYKKILIKVKYTPPKPPGEEPKPTLVPKQEAVVSSSSSSSDEELSPSGERVKKAKMIEALSRLGVYTRSYHFKDFKSPEAQIPTHIFSLSERALMEVHENTPTDLFKHNKSFLMRAYPKGIRFSSSNLDPSPFWRKGVQIVALNWQKWDAGMMLNEGMFMGSAGWVLKPEGYRSGSTADHQQNAAKHGILDLKIEVFAGQDIPLPPDEEKAHTFKPYVKWELHTENHERIPGEEKSGSVKANEKEYKRKTTTRRGQDPDFGREVIHFTGVRGVVPELSFLRLKVMDDDRLRDDLAAWACFRLDLLEQGYRWIHLYDAHGVATRGALLVRITKHFIEGSAPA